MMFYGSPQGSLFSWVELLGGIGLLQRLQEQPLTFIAAFFCVLFGPWTAWWQVYVTLILLDYATGFLAACKTGTADSDRARAGIIRKVGSITAVALAHQLDVFMGGSDLTRLVLSTFIASEAWSVIENLDDCDVPLPDALKDKIRALRSNNPRKRKRGECRKDAV